MMTAQSCNGKFGFLFVYKAFQIYCLHLIPIYRLMLLYLFTFGKHNSQKTQLFQLHKHTHFALQSSRIKCQFLGSEHRQKFWIARHKFDKIIVCFYNQMIIVPIIPICSGLCIDSLETYVKHLFSPFLYPGIVTLIRQPIIIFKLPQ